MIDINDTEMEEIENMITEGDVDEVIVETEDNDDDTNSFDGTINVTDDSNEDDNTDDDKPGMIDVDEGAKETEESDSGQDDDFVAEKFVLKFRGSEITPKSKDELINLAQRGVLFDHKINDISADRKKLNEEYEQLKELREFKSMIEANPKAELVLNEIKRRIGEETGNNVPEVNPEVLQMKQKLEQYESQQEEALIKSQLDSLMAKYPDDDWNGINPEGKSFIVEILEHTLNNGFPNLESAYKDKMWDAMRKNAEVEALKNAGPETIPDDKAVVAGSRAKSTKTKEVNLKDLSWDEIAKLALNDI